MARLRDFTGIEGTDLFAQDRGLERLLRALLPEQEHAAVFASLHACAARVAGPWAALAIEGSRPEHLPRIVHEDRVRNPLERVDFGAHTRQLRREVAEFGVLTKARSELHRFAMVYLLAHNGEASLMCPIACTDGLLRSLAAVGGDALRERYYDRVASAEIPFGGAQFVTDQAGGSDVGAIETAAAPLGEGVWAITGEKWFCSNPDEFFVVAARPTDGPAGTQGVAIFLVPRVLPDGRLNALRIRRLKDKLGTRSLPTAEIDFEGATGFPLGDPRDGFQHLMNYVINTSRLHNAANALGFMHRAYLEARNYAHQREAFGRTIVGYPLVQESLVGLLAMLERERTLFFRLLALLDAHGLVPGDPDQRLWQRCLTNMAKYRTAVALTAHIRDAILVFGGNGIVEDFTILPRLLRDALIIETWEGTHNTLCLQLVRDLEQFDFHGRWRRAVEDVLARWPAGVLGRTRERLDAAYQRVGRHLEAASRNPQWVQTHARRLVDGTAGVLAVAWMAEHAMAALAHDAGPALLTAVAADQLWGTDAERIEERVHPAAPDIAPALIDETPVAAPPWIGSV
jgi:alkylation response protein AidB-like acyl-CoA dehydrogenase